MGKIITIQEGGIGKQLTVDKLRTNLVGGGSCLWVPEDETQLSVKNITENGTYNASEEDYYGYSQVIVNVPGSSVTGTDPDTGEEVNVTKDPETGEIVKTVIPTEIRVTTMPAKTVYSNGEIIDMSGAVIKAYSATGQEMQTVPINQLSLNPRNATYDPEKDTGGKSSATSDLSTVFQQPIPCAETGFIELQEGDQYRHRRTITGNGIATTGYIRGLKTGGIISASQEPGSIIIRDEYVGVEGYTGYIPPGGSTEEPFNLSYEYNGKTVYYRGADEAGYSTTPTGGPYLRVSPDAGQISGIIPTNAVALIAWTIVYGDISTTPAGSPQTIIISWPRPGDGAILETSFDITVTGGDAP